jgi:hypothetical protein
LNSHQFDFCKRSILTNRLSKVEKSATKTEKSVDETKKSIKEISKNLPSWELLLEHDENGKPINGDVQRLIDAVYKGYQIKIRFDRTKDHFEVMDAQWLFVDSDKNLVHASNSNQVSQTKDASGNYFYIEKPYYYFVIVNNTGYHHAKRVYINEKDINEKELKTTSNKRYMTWIGLVPPSS